MGCGLGAYEYRADPIRADGWKCSGLCKVMLSTTEHRLGSPVSYVALSFYPQLSSANEPAERHISSGLKALAGTSSALCPPSIASTVWSPLLHKLPVPWLSSPDRFQRRCWWYQSRRGPARRGWY